MRRGFVGLLSVMVAAGFATGGAGLAAADPESPKTQSAVTGRGDEGPLAQKPSGEKVDDDLSTPQEKQRTALRERALKLVLNGERKVERINGASVVRLGKKPAALTKAEAARLRAGKLVKRRMVDQYVELSRESTDKIFVVLTEFGNQRATDIDPRYGDIDTDPETPGPTTFEGPLHNAIPAPNRSVDNSTIWQPNFSANHYRQLYFGSGKGVESLKTYYQKQSSGRYSVDGMVTDWVKVKYNEARYGRSDGFPCASNVCSNTWALLSDGLTAWVAQQKAKGVSDASIKASLKSYDQQDRYDFDGDGNFNEPDGYIDHFQIVHSGGDQADGDPYQGEDAIWSHRWYAYQGGIGTTGPANNKFGGTQIGTTGLWVGDYTIQPENGGLSVFAHEFGHDLGLPDLYDTAGGVGNPVEWWSLMSQSRLKAKTDVGIGNRPGDLGAWEKLFLGWLDYETAVAGQRKTFKLGPHEYNSKKAQALVVVLPKKTVSTALPTPPEGTKQWWSGTGDDLNSTLSRQITLPAAAATLSFKTSYNIEDCGADPCDYAYVQVNAGDGWKAIPGSITTAAEGNGIDGVSDGYVPATFDLSAYAGKTIGLRFSYNTDGAAQGTDPDAVAGFFVDDISVTAGGTTVFSDGAESGTGGWTAVGFTAVGAALIKSYDNYYIASNRTYTSYDRYLKSGPYNFGFGAALPDKVEFFSYQPGLLVSYWDTSFSDNNVSVHPGQGEILAIDAHPQPIYNLDGVPWRARIQLYDATFSTKRADSFTLHINGRANYIRGRNAQPLFDDTRTYWYAETPSAGVKTPKVGVTLKVSKQRGTSMTVRLGVSPSVASAATR